MEKKNLSQNLKDLDKVINWFDNQEEIEIENSLEKVKIGFQLIAEIKKQLKTAENEFEEIKKELENNE